MLDFVPPLSFGRGLSFLLDVTLLGLALGAFLVGVVVHMRRLTAARERERAQLATSRPLAASPHAVLSGTIVTQGTAIPVRATLHERRSEVDVSGWSEQRREVIAEPFDLETDTGMVRIEPGSDLLVAAELDEVSYGMGTRSRSAVLEHGTKVIAYGSLQRERHAFAGYRGGAEGWTLRAPRRASAGSARLLLADAALATRYDARIAVLRRFSLVALPLWLAFHALFSSAFLVASFTGTQTRTHLVDWTLAEPGVGKLPFLHHYRIETRTDDGLTLESRVVPELADFLRYQDVESLPLLRSSWPAACYVGGEAWTAAPAVGGAMLATLIALLMLRARYRQVTPWYDRR